jgi:hypothetical protein
LPLEAKRGILPARRSRGEFAMHSDPRFWALFAAIWFCLVLAVMNIAIKIHMLMDLSVQD